MLRVLLAVALAACTRSETGTRDLGATCLSPADCTALRCLPAPTWPGGFCTRPCAADTDCPVGSDCVDGVCLFACFDDQDCSFLLPGYACRQLGAALACAPDLPDGGTRDAP